MGPTRPALQQLLLLFVTSVSFSEPAWNDETRKVSVLQLGDGSLEVVTGHRLNSRVVAWGDLANRQQETGWLQLEISSNPAFPDHVQARGAGIVEGYLTRNSINEYYKEFFANGVCLGNPDFCGYMQKQIDINELWLGEMIKEREEEEPYWHMVSLFYSQMDGITEGWKIKTEKQEGSSAADFDLKYGLRFINYIADVFDYMEKFQSKNETSTKASRPTCSVLIKHLPEQNEMYVAHNTWHEYTAMSYRVLKKYNLPYRRLAGAEERVAAETATMSSYVGTIFSLDDFMTLSTGLVSTETSLFVYDSSLFEASQPFGQVFEPARVMAANRLARGGKEWTEMASQFNSGTYNNQWMVVDLSKVLGRRLDDGALWVMEQLPGRTWAEDQTSVLRGSGYWASYNRAFYPEVFEQSGAAELTKKHGSWFSYDKTPRALIMARDHDTVVDEQSMMKLMRYNDFQNDPLAIVPGCPKPIPTASISNRCDLTLPDSECSWQSLDYMVGHQGYGALDMKFTNRRLATNGNFWAVAGPTHGPHMPPFSWTTTNLTSLPSFMPIEVFDFEPSITNWKMEPISDAFKGIPFVSVRVAE